MGMRNLSWFLILLSLASRNRSQDDGRKYKIILVISNSKQTQQIDTTTAISTKKVVKELKEWIVELLTIIDVTTGMTIQ